MKKCFAILLALLCTLVLFASALATEVDPNPQVNTGAGNQSEGEKQGEGESKKEAADPAKPGISVEGQYVYSGSEQTAQVAGYDATTMNISGNTATNANSYTVSVTSKTGKWADGTSDAVTAQWTIGRAEPVSPENLTAWQGAYLSSVELPELWSWDSDALLATGGDVSFTASFAGNDNYLSASGVSLNVSVTESTAKVELPDEDGYSITPVAIVESLKYGEEYSFAVTVSEGYHVDTENFKIKVGDSELPDEYKEDATYKFTNTQIGADVELEISVEGIVMDDPEKPVISVDGSYSCTGAEQTAVVTGYNEKTMDISGNTGTGAGDYTVSVTPKTGKWADGTTEAVTADWTIARGTQFAPVAPTLKSRDSTQIVLNTIATNENRAAVEYSLDGKTWQLKTKFTGLTANKEYTFYARYAETKDFLASEPSQGAKLTTKKKTSSGSSSSSSSGSSSKSSSKTAGSSTWTNPFTDISESDDFYDAAVYAAKNGLMEGIRDDQFGPNILATRGMVVQAIYAMEGKPEPSVNILSNLPFTDVTGGTAVDSAILWAAENGIVTGYDDGRFAADDIITREQMVSFFYAYAKYKGYDVSVGEDTNIMDYTDVSEIGTDAVSAVQWACGADMIDADGEKFKPQGEVKRSRLAVTIYTFCEEYDN